MQSVDQLSEKIMGKTEEIESETHHLVQNYPEIPIMSGKYEAAIAVERLELPEERGAPGSWPKTAQQLRNSTTSTYLALCWDVGVTLLPTAFLGEYEMRTVKRTVVLHRLDAIGIIIVALWLLSPLDGQDSLRILAIRNRSVASQGTLHYFNISSAPILAEDCGVGAAFDTSDGGIW